MPFGRWYFRWLRRLRWITIRLLEFLVEGGKEFLHSVFLRGKRSTERLYPNARIGCIHICVCNRHHLNRLPRPPSSAPAATDVLHYSRDQRRDLLEAFDRSGLSAIEGFDYQSVLEKISTINRLK